MPVLKNERSSLLALHNSPDMAWHVDVRSRNTEFPPYRLIQAKYIEVHRSNRYGSRIYGIFCPQDLQDLLC